MTVEKASTKLPKPADFRAWMVAALPVAGVSAAAVARDLGLHRNTLSEFMAKPGRGIGLGTAASVAEYLGQAAASAGVDLPEFEGQADG